MKYKSLLALAAASLTMAFACQKPVDLGPEKVVIDSEATHEFPVEGGEYTLQLTATVDWTLQGYDESVKNWLSISPSSGTASADAQTITIKALPNEGADRKADIVFYGNVMNKAPLTITQKGDLVEDGTAEHPYSVATALLMADGSGWTNDNPSEQLHVMGTVSRIEEYQFDTYGSICYYISDDGSENNELYVFGGYNFDGKRFTSEEELQTGDDVVICGQLVVWNGIVEFKDHNYLVSRNGEGAEVVPPVDPTGDGTEANPYNVSGVMKYYEDNGWADGNESPEIYAKGIISYVAKFDERYGSINYYISDDGTSNNEFYVYAGYNFNDTQFSGKDDLKAGDEVVIRGRITTYNGEPQFDMHNYLVSLNGQTSGGGGDDPDPDEPVVEPTSATKVTIDEFLDKPVNNTDWYELTGTIINIVSGNAYGNFTIEDETGSVYIYGMVQAWAGGKNDQSFNNIGLKVGDIVTLWSLRDEYGGEPQGGGSDIPAIYKSHEDGVPVTYPEGTVFLTFPDDNQDNNKVNGYDEPWIAMSGNYSFTMTQFNNYEWNNWTYVRCGRKNGPSVASIATVNAMPALASVEVVANKLNSDKVNSIVLSVYSDADMANQLGQDIAPEGELEAGTLEFVVPVDIVAENLYYKLTFDCAKGDGNGFVEIGKVTYIAAE